MRSFSGGEGGVGRAGREEGEGDEGGAKRVGEGALCLSHALCGWSERV